MPFGYTESEAKVLVSLGLVDGEGIRHNEALGKDVRRASNNGGTRVPRMTAQRPRHERLIASAVRLDDAGLDALYEAVRAERARRRRKR